jgi:predicted nucleic acid-binding protein
MARMVLDCSLALAWCFEDEGDARAESLLDFLRGNSAIVPAIWRLEALNAFVIAERRGRITLLDTSEFLVFLDELPIKTLPYPAASELGSVLSLCRAYGLSAYDAAYLGLAIKFGVPLASLDKRLNEAARSKGVALA